MLIRTLQSKPPEMSSGPSTYGEWLLLRALSKLLPKFYREAVCETEDLKLFFPGRGQSSNIKKAVEICGTCPVQRDCHNYAMDNRIVDGVWGGSSPEQRQKWLEQCLSNDEAWALKTEQD
jgi:hypothetical protein